MSLSAPLLFIALPRNTSEKTLVFILRRKVKPKESVKLCKSLRIRAFHQAGSYSHRLARVNFAAFQHVQ